MDDFDSARREADEQRQQLLARIKREGDKIAAELQATLSLPAGHTIAFEVESLTPPPAP